jgi:two-component system response regulator RegX3
VDPTERILVIEDDPVQAQALALILRHEGYEVDIAETGADGLDLVHRAPPPRVVLLDVMLPDLSGVEVVRRVRTGSSVPIILLTARRQESDKIVGLDAGADDYVTKPYSPNELLARIRVWLRRGDGRAARTSGTTTLDAGSLSVDVRTRRVSVGGRSVELSAREFEILRVLAQAAGAVVSRRDLLRAVWGPEFFGDERMLDVYVRRVRKKIEQDPNRPTLLHTVWGVGYRLADESPEPA